MRYVWKCTECNREVEVSRSRVAEIDVAPSRSESEQSDSDTHEHQWVRIPARTSFLLQGQGWFLKGGY